MSRPRLLQASRLLSRTVQSSNVARPALRTAVAVQSNSIQRPSFSTCIIRPKGIMPDTSEPANQPAASTNSIPQPVELSDGEFHEVADFFLENTLSKFEEIQDRTDEVDVEFSSGVMTIRVPEKGTYVLNKQPPNKQIWLSSPISGPKRYDWCIIGDGQHDKEDTAQGRWVYARDGSTLDALILEELDVDVLAPIDG